MFQWVGQTNEFVLFSFWHVLMLAMISGSIVLMILNKEWLKHHKKVIGIIQLLAGVLMWSQEIMYNVWQYHNGLWSLGRSLPFHLCGLSIIFGPILYFRKSNRLFDLLYYWSIGAAIALFMPDIGPYGYPSFRAFQFFLSHGLIVFEIAFMLIVLDMKPSRGSVKYTWIVTNVIMIFIGFFNFIFDGNYFYLAHKPETASFMDFFGPWPFYIIVIECIGLVLFALMYLPFKKQNNEGN